MTIYPGRYDGRTTHVRFKVFLDDRTVLTCAGPPPPEMRGGPMFGRPISDRLAALVPGLKPRR
ncbi:hypothetical protein [Bradyrhizobium sp. McL0616]|uniref:hypothetical protein n=1 Tax=Bradyrhizobium sp. McL0616 TaxID=3415674 RepID=UPI003CEDFEC1